MARNDLRFKNFNGKSYHFFKGFKTKAEAKSLANKFKKEGDLCRVVPISHSKFNYGVYVR